MQLKNYQKTAVDKLVKIAKSLLEKEGSRQCVFKAPTGSGKTIMVADFLEKIGEERMPGRYAFLWISGYNLHRQSREKLEQYLDASRYAFSYLEDIQDNELRENEIAFVNWHSLTKQDATTGAYKNIFMRDNEADRNLRTFITKTKEKGLEIILIVDESHYHYWSDRSQELVQNVIGPKLTIEVSATPKLEPSGEDIASGDAGIVAVRFDEVIAEGMIKSEVVINKEIGKLVEFHDAVDDVILAAAIEKQKELAGLYEKEGVEINPLVLVQLPNEGEKTSALDQDKLEKVQIFLRDTYGMTVKNGEVGIWLSEEKENLLTITDPRNQVKALIFKQAIALGWDCPRAQILVMFRDIQSLTFQVQTVGRILRMPEAKHYDSDELNRAFVYTNLGSVKIADDKDSLGLFHINPARRKLDIAPADLPSVYLRRTDYCDLTLSFRRLLIDGANEYFGIENTDMANVAYEKADVKLDLLPEELEIPVIADAIIKQIDGADEIVGNILHFSVPEDDFKYRFELFAKVMSLPYAPVRSHTKIQHALYDWFDNYLGFKSQSRLNIQRIIVCSENNQRIFAEVIEKAKERFREVKRKEIKTKQKMKESLWNVPPIDYFNELYEKVSADRYALDSCYLLKNRTEPERAFEAVVDGSDRVKWWIKNEVNREEYFSIPYTDPIDKLTHSFYPDYIVMFTDGTVGIYETKAGITLTSPDTSAKSDALQEYISTFKEKSRKIRGGIVAKTSSGLFLYAGEKFNADPTKKGWGRLDM